MGNKSTDTKCRCFFYTSRRKQMENDVINVVTVIINAIFVVINFFKGRKK